MAPRARLAYNVEDYVAAHGGQDALTAEGEIMWDAKREGIDWPADPRPPEKVLLFNDGVSSPILVC